ncbi:pyrophosphate--fructose 6-phosphate 1-phosphotransferase subunit beta-like [Papaver somniferum]|uniref:pyrophosphate--fructose 6-phosphate 1-phosphotransferase subunit beta-like n=1 Tax=Papaver somniferum TaxID=3469 RepID=UPI000E705F12|nr:pyrophosphate--fructose 6-phosphate 1-phosphotransferase subunit beta-like [Papaver somniferum]
MAIPRSHVFCSVLWRGVTMEDTNTLRDMECFRSAWLICDDISIESRCSSIPTTLGKLRIGEPVVVGDSYGPPNVELNFSKYDDRWAQKQTKIMSLTTRCKTIDGDLKSKEVPTSFGFDTTCKICTEMIGNIMTNPRSTRKYHHFVKIMGRAASLECALQTHPNVTIIGEEVAAKKQTLENVTDYITDIICKRAELGYHYGVILISEGLLDFIPEVQQLIAELNEILVHDVIDKVGA